MLLSGGAAGVDSSVPAAARLLGVQCLVVRPDYPRFGRRAPLVRDERMVAMAGAVVAVWDRQSPGTAFTLRCARRRSLPVFVFAPLPPG